MTARTPPVHYADAIPLGLGYYTVPEAARLLKAPARNISRWLGGYSYQAPDGRVTTVTPLWTPQLPGYEHHIELGFRDLIELKFVVAFLNAGLGLKTIRYCLKVARELVGSDHPFSTNRFKTDGRTIFLETPAWLSEYEAEYDELPEIETDRGSNLPRVVRWPREARNLFLGNELLDLKTRQYAIKEVIERSFKDLDIEDEVVSRWRPFNGKRSIVVDPARAFGQPIVTDYGVPTIVLADAIEAEGSIDRVAKLYEVSVAVVRDAEKFEKQLYAS
jgi:uncharacterized protein (DUF433 family)